MKGTRWFDTAAIVVTIAVLVGLGFVLRPQPSPTIRVAPSSAHVDRPQLAAKTGPSALFIGDSYTRGYVKEMSYVCLAATQMGWVCNLSAVGSTGYLAGGPANRFDIDEGIGQSTSFAERIPKLAQTYQPDMVFLDGGRNDLDLPRDDVYDAMIWTIAGVRSAWPTAKIYFIRPRILPRPGDDLGFDDEFIARLRADPAAQDVVVLDPIVRLTDTDTSALLLSDEFHPNQRGQQALSSALVDSLLAEGFALRT